MLKEETIDKIVNFIKENFDVYDLTSEDFQLIMDDNYGEIDFEYASGASKGVFIVQDDEVIKMPFSKEEVENWEDEGDEEYVRADMEVNYCDLEYENYLRAKEEGLEKYFAAIRPIRSIKDVQLYAQEFCECDDFYESSNESNNLALAVFERSISDVSLPRDWAGEFVETYGEKELERLYNFIAEYEINDLHNGNVGRKMDGTLCLIDYSGYC